MKKLTKIKDVKLGETIVFPKIYPSFYIGLVRKRGRNSILTVNTLYNKHMFFLYFRKNSDRYEYYNINSLYFKLFLL